MSVFRDLVHFFRVSLIIIALLTLLGEVQMIELLHTAG